MFDDLFTGVQGFFSDIGGGSAIQGLLGTALVGTMISSALSSRKESKRLRTDAPQAPSAQQLEKARKSSELPQQTNEAQQRKGLVEQRQKRLLTGGRKSTRLGGGQTLGSPTTINRGVL